MTLSYSIVSGWSTFPSIDSNSNKHKHLNTGFDLGVFEHDISFGFEFDTPRRAKFFFKLNISPKTVKLCRSNTYIMSFWQIYGEVPHKPNESGPTYKWSPENYITLLKYIAFSENMDFETSAQ